MSTAVRAAANPSLSVPATQNTAPVFEFNCLYTHEVRRKSKRWQDGFLRFHTFNKRIMVYDVPRNLIGDTHWTSDEPLQEGDQMMLDRKGVLVEVTDNVGQTQTDLTELMSCAHKASGKRNASSPVRTPPTITRPASSVVLKSAQLKHRSLNALLKTPRGPTGKATISTNSPFDMRREDIENQNWNAQRAPKRQRLGSDRTQPEAMATALPVSKPQLPASRRMHTGGPATLTRDTTVNVVRQPHQGAECDEGATRQLSPVSRRAVQPRATSAMKTHAPQRMLIDLTGTSKSDQSRESVGPKYAETSSYTIGSAPRPEQTSNPQTGVSQAKRTDQRATSGDAQVRESCEGDGSDAGKRLRSAPGIPRRKMLVCQNQLGPSSSSERRTQQQQLEERLAKIVRKQGKSSSPAPVPGSEYGEQARNSSGSGTVVVSETTAKPKSRSEEGLSNSKFASGLASRTERQGLRQELQIEEPLPFDPIPGIGKGSTLVPGESARRKAPPAQQNSAGLASAAASTLPPAREQWPLEHCAGSPFDALSVDDTVDDQPVPRQSEAQQERVEPPKPARSRRKKGVGRREIRKSAAACFQILNNPDDGTSAAISSNGLQEPESLPQAESQTSDNDAKSKPGPWSREAFDLFKWRPPGWDEETWRLVGPEDG